MNGMGDALAADLGGKIVRVVVLGAVAFGAYEYTRYLQIKAEVADNTAQQAVQRLSESNAVIAQQQALIRAQDRLAASLDGERTALRQLANARDIQTRNLIHENAEIRAWAAGPVPADLVRLREHGTITGAAAYRQFLSEGATLQPARRAGAQ